LRFVLKRQIGGLSPPDVLLVVLLADAAQNGMADEYRSVTEGVFVVTTIIFWNFAIDWLEYHFPAMERLLRPAPLATHQKWTGPAPPHATGAHHHGRA